MQTLNPNTLELARIWADGGYHANNLVVVGQRELLCRLPVSVDWFLQLQAGNLEAYKTQVGSHSRGIDSG